MNVTDIVILIALALGAIGGFKSGVIKKTANFVGIFIIIILSFYLKTIYRLLCMKIYHLLTLEVL